MLYASPPDLGMNLLTTEKFYNLVLFMSSVAVFSLVAQRMTVGKVSA